MLFFFPVSSYCLSVIWHFVLKDFAITSLACWLVRVRCVIKKLQMFQCPCRWTAVESAAKSGLKYRLTTANRYSKYIFFQITSLLAKWLSCWLKGNESFLLCFGFIIETLGKLWWPEWFPIKTKWNKQIKNSSCGSVFKVVWEIEPGANKVVNLK